jgi:hypothetical protein
MKVSAAFKASTISSGVIRLASKVTVLISLKPLNPDVTFFTPGSPSRAALPTEYHLT